MDCIKKNEICVNRPEVRRSGRHVNFVECLNGVDRLAPQSTGPGSAFK